MIVGFLGTGAISEAIIRGLCDKANYSDRILISKRSPGRSAKLAHDYDHVEVVAENASLVEKSDWVIVAVLPGQVEATLAKLTFRSDQKVISLAAGIPLARLSEWVFPCTNVSRAIPMPPIEFGKTHLSKRYSGGLAQQSVYRMKNSSTCSVPPVLLWPIISIRLQPCHRGWSRTLWSQTPQRATPLRFTMHSLR